MTRFLLALAISTLSFRALAAGEEPKPSGGGDPMAGWKPAKVAREQQDRKEIDAVLKAMDDAGKKGDLDAAAAHVDFPVLMLTDDSKGQAMGETWTKEQWSKVMKPFYEHPNPDMKMSHRYTIFLVSDSLATVADQWSMTMGPKKMSSRSSSILVRKDGKWRVKSMMEGGWGDVPMATGQGEAAPQGGSSASAK
jgi:ketosteroid isomerase-like protein